MNQLDANIARNMLSWTYRSINHCCIKLVHLYYFT